MSSKLIYFGMIAEVLGKTHEVMPVSGLTILQLKEKLEETYPVLVEKNYQFAVNQELVDANHKLQGTEEIALLPPFSGG
jgi:molybdopterin synthase sulfur carrier subunit